MKPLVIALLALTTAASTAVAQDVERVEQENDNLKRLLKTIAELKEQVEVQKRRAAVQRARSQKLIAVEKQKAVEALQATKRQAGAAEKRRVEIEIIKQRKPAEDKAGSYSPPRVRIFKRPHPKFVRVRIAHPKHPAPLREAQERLENLRAAVKHLKAAGMKELAAEAAKRAEKMQDEIHAAMKKHHHHAHGEKGSHKIGPGGMPHQIRELSAAIKQLREQVQGLQKAVERLERRK